MSGKIDFVVVLDAKRLEIAWEDGRIAPIDFTHLIATREVLTPLQKKSEFTRARVSADGLSVEWPCGGTFGSLQLRRWADEQAGEVMRVEDFRAWMDKHALTQEGAAHVLGLSRRMVAYYSSGEKPIPKTVMLATEGWDRRVEAC